MSNTETCPYCAHEQEYTGDPLEEDQILEEECDSCKKTFRIIQHCDYWLECDKADE